MERAEILRRLVEAHALVKRGYENIQQQRNLISQLEQHAQEAEAALARALLYKLKDSLAQDLEVRHRAAKELADFDRGSEP